MVALLRSWDATQRFTEAGLSNPKCLNLPEITSWCIFPLFGWHSTRTSVYLPTNSSGTAWSKWLPTPPWLFARALSFKIQLRAEPPFLNELSRWGKSLELILIYFTGSCADSQVCCSHHCWSVLLFIGCTVNKPPVQTFPIWLLWFALSLFAPQATLVRLKKPSPAKTLNSGWATRKSLYYQGRRAWAAAGIQLKRMQTAGICTGSGRESCWHWGY